MYASRTLRALIGWSFALLPASLAAQRDALAPTNVAIVATGTSATVTWAPVQTRGVTYRVLRALDAKRTGSDLTRPIASATLVDASVVAGVTYFYQVIAVYDDGSAGTAAPVAFTMSAPYASPSYLTAAHVGLHSISLTWPTVPGVTSYRLFGPGLPAAGAVASSQPFKVVDVPTGYQSYAISSEYPGAANRPGLAQTQVIVPPFHGLKLSVNYTRNIGGIALEFDVATAEPLTFHLYHDDGQGGALTEVTSHVSWTRLPTAQPSITHVVGLTTAEGLSPTFPYRFQMMAQLGSSNVLIPTAIMPVTMPHFNVRATVLVSPDRIVVEWSPFGWNPSGAVAYWIQKGTVTAASGLVMDDVRDATGNRLTITGPLKFEDAVVQRGVRYFYMVCALLQNGQACPGVEAIIPIS